MGKGRCNVNRNRTAPWKKAQPVRTQRSKIQMMSSRRADGPLAPIQVLLPESNKEKGDKILTLEFAL